MAQTISHDAAAQVKTNPEQVTCKEALLRLLERTFDQLSDLQDDFLDIQECLDPEPRPLPETVAPGTLLASLTLHDEGDAVQQGVEALTRAVEDFRRAVKRMSSRLESGRNARAWKLVLQRVEAETAAHVEAVHTATTSLLRHTRTVAALVTFAQADTLPESIGKEEEAGNE